MAIKQNAHGRKKWKSNMSDRDRFNNIMHYKPADRSFNMEFGYWPEVFQQWPIFQDNNITTNEAANLFFGFDKIEIQFSSPFLDPPFERKVIEQRDDTIIMMNEEGLLAEVPKNGSSSIPHFIKPSIVMPDDWQKCKYQRIRRDDSARRVDIDEILKNHPNDRDYPLGLWCGSMIGVVRNILTLEGLAYAVYDYPAMVEDMVETCCVIIEDFLDQVLGKVNFDFAVGWEDICFKNGPIVSVDFFKNIVVPRYKRINKKLKAYGIDIWYVDCDGDVRPILPLLLDSGINCLFPNEVNGSGHPSDLLKEYGTELRIMGGFDKMKLAEGPLAIKNYMETLLPLVERGGYIPFCDHLCPPNVKQQDYLYYLDLKEKMFGM
jgi:uroporphyrinogen decarboxylase